MPKLVERTFILTEEQSAYIDRQVESGAFASPSDVVAACLDLLLGKDEAFEEWYRAEILPVIKEMERDPSASFTVEEVRHYLHAEIDAHSKTGTG